MKIFLIIDWKKWTQPYYKHIIKMCPNITLVTYREIKLSKKMISPVCEGLRNPRGGTASRCLLPLLSPYLNRKIQKFSNIGNKNLWNNPIIIFLSQISGQILFYIIRFLHFMMTQGRHCLPCLPWPHVTAVHTALVLSTEPSGNFLKWNFPSKSPLSIIQLQSAVEFMWRQVIPRVKKKPALTALFFLSR